VNNMEKARLMDTSDDYKKLGINAEHVEMWEDSRRNKDSGKGNWEWWYFDSILEDGTKVVIQFFTKGIRTIKKDGDFPSASIKVTTAEGELYSGNRDVKTKDTYFGEDKCDVRFGNNRFVGDIKEYDIYVETENGLGADLHLTSNSKPYRPGTAYFGFGDDGEYFTWLCSVPKGEITGTLTVDGKEKKVHGTGYHDHQWGNAFYLTEWNHWIWARQSFNDYSILNFDLVTSEKYGFERFPIVFVQDKDGELIFESRDNVKCQVIGKYHEDKYSDKDYPTGMIYLYENNGTKLTYTLCEKEVLECQGMKNLPLVGKMLGKKMGMDLSYSRYLADGEMILETPEEKIERKGELIYEMMYPGNSFEGHM
jgi:hypothetical protein